jgi:hypothetical protein
VQIIKKRELHAYLFYEQLHDLTDELKNQQVTLQENDQILPAYELQSQKDMPHFYYFSPD